MTTGIASGVANGFLDALGNAADYTAPTEFWVKLHTGDPGAAGTSNAAANTTRQQASFAAASGGSMTTNAVLEWLSVSDSETYSHVSFWSASSGGTFLGSDSLEAPIVMVAGRNFRIPSGNLDVAFTAIAA